MVIAELHGQLPGTAAWDSSATAEPAYPASSRPAQVLRPWGAGRRVAHTRENQRTKANRMEARAELWELPREPGEGKGGSLSSHSGSFSEHLPWTRERGNLRGRLDDAILSLPATHLAATAGPWPASPGGFPGLLI